MSQPSVQVAALEIALAHFPNVPFEMRDAEIVYGPEIAAGLAPALLALRGRLEAELERLRAVR